MIWVYKNDRSVQRILWRKSPEEPVYEYRLNTVTYGTVSVSFIATSCLQVVANKLQGSNARAAQVIFKNFYMDDFICSGDILKKRRSIRSLPFIKH